MKIRLHAFKKRLTPREVDDMRTIEKWTDRSSLSEMSLVGDAACIMNDDDNNLRLMIICENGNVALDISLDSHDAETISSLIDSGSEKMADLALSHLSDIELAELKEMKDVVGGFIMSDFGSNKLAES